MEGVFVFSVIRVLGSSHDYAYPYNYDDLYRLSSSDVNGAIDASYTLAMEYSPSGNILKKTMAATKEILGNGTFESYDNEYSYNGAHTLGNLTDLQGGAPGLTFNFDGNGNMITQQLYNDNSGLNERYLCWDEENRLSATRDNNYVTANIYDASGNRSWKLAGEMNWMWQNGSGWQGYGDLNLRTWYQSELMTITDVGFTKHYFITGQKIASKLGEGFLNSDDLPSLEGEPLVPIYSEYSELARAQTDRLRRDFECLGLNYDNFSPGGTYFEMLKAAEQTEIGEEGNVYFYHSDHLGSSSFLTDGGGVATQHLQYMPFGEDLVHQQNTAAYYTPYTFSGKERDFETGLSYFGARYYDAGLSIWLSVDPMSDERPSLSPYNYCQWNPVMLVDPTGMLDEDAIFSSGKNNLENGRNSLQTMEWHRSMQSGGKVTAEWNENTPQGGLVNLSDIQYRGPMIAGNGPGDDEKKPENNTTPTLGLAMTLVLVPEGATTIAGVRIILYFGGQYLMEGRGEDFWNSLVYEYRHPSQEPTTNPPRGFDNNSLPQGSGGAAVTTLMTVTTGQIVIGNYNERLQQIGITPSIQAQRDNTNLVTKYRTPIIKQGIR